MFKLSKMTDYAVVCLGRLARKQRNLMSATDLLKITVLTFLMVKKLLKLLVSKSDIIRANRGGLGGYILNRSSSNISVVKIIEAANGTIIVTSCVDRSESSCENSNICFLGGKWKKINEIFRKSLDEIFLKYHLSYQKSFLIDYNKDAMVDRIN